MGVASVLAGQLGTAITAQGVGTRHGESLAVLCFYLERTNGSPELLLERFEGMVFPAAFGFLCLYARP